MTAEKAKICRICRTSFQGRKDAKTCSPVCRKRLQRNLRALATYKAKRLESALGREVQRIAAVLLQDHVIHQPLVLADERGSIPASPAPAPTPAPTPTTAYLHDVMSESLEPLAGAETNQEQPPANDFEPTTGTVRRGRFSLFGYNRAALLTTGLVLLAIIVISAGSFLLVSKRNTQSGKSSSSPASYAVSSLPLGSVQPNQPLQVGNADQLTINGQLKVNNTIVVTPTSQPKSPVSGQIYYDKTANAPFYYNGSQFVSMSPQQGVSSIAGLSGDIGLGNGLTANGNQISVSSTLLQQINNGVNAKVVTSLQGQTGALALGAGSGVSINGLNISNSGVLSLAGTANQLNVSASSGNVTLSLPQDIAISSSPTFSGVTLGSAGSTTGVINLANNTNSNLSVIRAVAPSGSGNAGYNLPSIAGGSNDTICLVTLANCGSAGGITGGGTAGTIAIFTGGGSSVGNSILTQSGSNVTASGTVAIQGANALTLGTASTNTGAIIFQGSGGAGHLTLAGPTTPNAGNFTLTLPTIASNDTLCAATLANCTAVGAAGGDLTGSYPNPTIAKVQGTTVTLASLASGDVLQYNGSAIVNGHITNSNLTAGSFSNITGVGALTSGSIAAGFGTISTGNNITTTATAQGNIVNGVSALQLNGVDINTGGTLSNVAYLNGTGPQTFTGNNKFTGTLLAQNAADSTAAFQVQNAAGTSNLLVADTTDNRLAVGQATASYTLDVAGDINSTGVYRLNGTTALQMRATNNVFVGGAGNNTQTGADNNGLGTGALSSLTNGAHNNAFGQAALQLNQDGDNNVAIGSAALGSNVSGSENVAVGRNALTSSTGYYNVALGYQAGYTTVGANANTTGSNNTFIGSQAGPGSTTQLQNASAIGYAAVVNQNDSLTLGCVNGVNGCTANTKVGIDTATPGYTLDVNGNINTNTAYLLNGVNINTAGTLTNVAYLNGTGPQTFTGNNLFKTSSTTAFQVQNAGGQNLLVADTTDQQLAVGPAAVPGNGALTVGTNTTAASGGLYLGTDTDLYRSAASTLKTDGALVVAGNLTDNGAALFQNSTNSATAFQVQNAAGTDNSDTLLGINTIYPASNLVTNGSFEQDTNGWSAKGTNMAISTVNSVGAPYGSSAMQITNNGSAPSTLSGAKYPVALSSNTSYAISFYAELSGSSSAFSTLALGRSDDGATDTPCSSGSGTTTTFTPVSTNWIYVSCTFTTGTVSGSPYIFFGQNDTTTGRIWYVDGVSLVQTSGGAYYSEGQLNWNGLALGETLIQPTVNSSNALQVAAANGNSLLQVNSVNSTIVAGVATTINSTEVISTSSANALRVRNGTTLAPLVLANTNILNIDTNGSFENSNTTATGYASLHAGSTLTVDTTANNAYIGNNTGKVVTTGSAVANSGMKYNMFNSKTGAFLFSNSTTYTLTFYAKIPSGTFTTLDAGRSDDGTTGAETTCTLNSTTVTTYWQRYSCSFTTGTISGTPYFFIGQTDAGVAHTYFLDGIQIEAGASADNYREGSVQLNGDIASPAVFRPQSDSASSLQIQNSSGTDIVNVNSALGQVTISGATNSYNAANATLYVGSDSGTSRSINASGTINANGADYAEWIPWSGAKPDTGSVVTYQGSNYVVSSPETAAFVGNDGIDESNGIMVTFAGQVPVRVTGAVASGDILVDNGDGTAKAINPSSASLANYLSKIGIAQEGSTDSGVKLVKAAIGTTSANVAANLQQSNSSLTDLNVSGTATINNLSVTGSATVGLLHVTGSAQFDGDITVAGHIITAGGQPTSQPQIAAGGSASVSVDGTDTTGTITINTGSNPTAGGLAKILFSKTYGKAPHIVLSPSNDKAAGLRFYKGSTNATNFTFDAVDSPAPNTTYTFDYFIAQ